MIANIAAFLHITGCEFRNNVAENVGGAIFIYAIQNGSNVTVIDSTFTDNFARKGSAIETFNSNYLSVFNCTFSNIIALIGSTVYTESKIQPSSVVIINSIIIPSEKMLVVHSSYVTAASPRSKTLVL